LASQNEEDNNKLDRSLIVTTTTNHMEQKPHDDDYSKEERKLLSVAASMLQAYAGVCSVVIYQQIAMSPASPELLISCALFVGQICCSWDYFKSCLAQDRQQHIEKKEAYIEKSGVVCRNNPTACET
jgi:hypothetical protein